MVININLRRLLRRNAPPAPGSALPMIDHGKQPSLPGSPAPARPSPAPLVGPAMMDLGKHPPGEHSRSPLLSGPSRAPVPAIMDLGKIEDDLAARPAPPSPAQEAPVASMLVDLGKAPHHANSVSPVPPAERPPSGLIDLGKVP